MFGKDDPQTTALTIIELMLVPLSKESGIDVFMYVQAHEDNTSKPWNGDPWDFEPRIADTTACEPFSSHPFFHKTGNKFFCLVEPEVALMTAMLRNHSMWNTYTVRN
jgi:hypothetical protein